MKKLLTTLLTFTISITLLAQKFVPADHNPTIFITTKSDSPPLGIALQEAVAEEIEKELSCAKVTTRFQLEGAIAADRERVLAGTSTGRLYELGEKLNCEYLINLSIFDLEGRYATTASTTAMGKKLKTVSRQDHFGERNNVLNDFHALGKKIAMDLVVIELCPFKGKVTINNIKTDEEIHERGNRCGKNNEGYFQETIKKKYDSQENLVLEKKKRVGADGSMMVRSSSEYIWHTIDPCVMCKTYEGDAVVGTDVDNVTTTDYTETLKDEFKVSGLAPMNEGPITSKYLAEVAIDFDVNQGTYMVRVKAVSKPGTYVKSKKVKNDTACRKDKDPDEEVKNDIIVPFSRSYGPFKGKPTDKTLSDSKSDTFSEKHDGGTAVSTYQMNFSFTR